METIQNQSGFGRIMVLEDNEELATLIKRKLKREGYAVTVCSDEKEAIPVLLKNAHDVLLLDYQLTKMTGKEIIDHLVLKGCTVPFIIMTGHGDERIAVEMMKMGAMDYIVKDIHFTDLLPSILHRAVGILKTRSALKNAEKSLKESEEKYRSLFEKSLDAITILSGMPPVPLMVNPAFTELTGYTAEESLSFTPDQIWSVVHPDDRSFVKQNFCDRILQNRAPEKFEFRLITKHNTLRWVEVMNSLSKKGDTLFIQSIYRDITERKESEKALKKSEERFKLAIEAATHGIFDWNFQTGVMYFSPFFYTMLGYEPNELPASFETWKNLLHPDDLHPMTAIIDQYHENKINTHQTEFRMKSKSGDWLWILSRGKVVERDFTGLPTRLVGTYVDITGRRLAEEERLKLENQLRQAQKMEAVGQLAGGVAHDFNNMLFVITGYTEMIMDELPQGRLYNRMNSIMKTAERATNLVRQLLLFSRKEAMQLKTVDLNDLIENMTKMIRRIIGEHISLEFIPDSSLRIITADTGQIEQVLMNLCLNARDAMPQGGRILIETKNVTIDGDFCKQHTWAKPGEYVRCSVTDTGIGIPDEVQEHIFEPFYTTKEVGKGTGLGLAAVYGIVKSHEGMIHVYSEPGSGAVFKIYLPSSMSSSPGLKADVASESKPLSGSGTILLAEDEEPVRNMLIEILELNGYRVIPAQDGEDAIRQFDLHCPEISIALLDIVMPKISGLKVLERIKAVCPNIPVILMTGYSRGALNSMFSSELQYEILQKPHSHNELLIKIHELMRS